ncbi:PadR family transcriptional regulator [Pelagibius litoralis]|uniref:PadR family transcriptional regulator n=1 Tax=Pelagibius litoralis TaxID=374515 RepID=A0A967F0T5_9PROT|nr:PadR family transcriptional regulator [Pelagibius litoralis]NIA70900.1 PadR family transcriptional regulator [Pelagibius litoralis]
MDSKTLCLGVLSRGEASGYEIKKAFEEGPFSHFHQASFGAIYPSLNALSNEGLVACRAQAQEKRPDKKIYSLTAKGRDAFAAALLSQPDHDRVRSDFLFILFFAQFLPPARVGALIDERIAWYRQSLERMEDCTETNVVPAGAAFVRGMGIAVYRAAAEYLETNRDALVADVAEPEALVAE